MQIFFNNPLLGRRNSKRTFNPIRSRVFRPVAVMLGVCLFTGAPVHAGPVAISEVIQVLGSYQNPPEIRLRSLSQTASTPLSEMKGSTVNSQQADGAGTNLDGAVSQKGSLLAGVANDPQRGVEIIDQGEVEGTICDCGEILIPGAFPKWPLLFLAAIPLFFIDTDDDIETPSSTPTPPPPGPSPEPTQGVPTPTPTTPIPEPASLLLFGSGLAAFGAGLRRRYTKARMASQGDGEKEA